MMFHIMKKSTQWVFGGLALLFLPMTAIMFLLSSDSHTEWKEDLKEFHLSFYK